jgi:hypothetical protein
MTNSYKKESPLAGFAGFGGGVGALSAKSGAAFSTKYVDEVFSTYTYIGDGTNSHQIVNGVPLSSTGGLIWGKERGNTGSHYQFDTVRGLDKRLKSNSDAGEETDTFYSSVNSDGYTIEKTTSVNVSSNTYVSWTWAKKEGLLDIVSYTGNGSNRLINHSLGSVPGMMIVKCTSETRDWVVWQRHLETPANYAAGYTSGDYYLKFNDEAARSSIDTNVWDRTDPTATQFKVGTSDFTNKNGESYIAYIFAGGASPAATAKSVQFDGSGDYFTTSTSSDYTFGTGDFTIECWFNLTANPSNQPHIADNRTDGSYTDQFVLYIDTDYKYKMYKNGNVLETSIIPTNTWNHVALVRSSGVTRLYLNGTSQGTYTDTNNYSTTSLVFGANAVNFGHDLNGRISNLRIVKGTAVYTSQFKPPTEPLTNITNTKLLCFNNSSTTGTTVGTITASGDPTAYADSPFDDPAAFKFGENEDTPILKTGVYVGDATAGNKVELGWEPSWIMFKRLTGGTASWEICDVMRGNPAVDNTITQDANFLRANTNGSEFTNRPFSPYPTGFEIRNTGGGSNADGDRYIYMAMRRPDGYVGKPPSAGTDVFAMDVGNASNTIPTMDSGFPVDFAIMRNPGTVDNNNTGTRLTTQEGMKTNSTAMGANYNSSTNQWMWDSNVGWLANSNYSTSTNSWMWKRGKGMDVVTWVGNGIDLNSVPRFIPHNLNQTPEMVWIKYRSKSGSTYGGDMWYAWHKGLNGGSSPYDYRLALSSNGSEASSQILDSGTSATHLGLRRPGSDAGATNDDTANYIAFLFASANDEEGNPISKCGYYNGSNSELTITTGFQPRFLIVKAASTSGHWNVLDTTRGWAAGNDPYIKLNSDAAEVSSYDNGAPTATGFTLAGNNGGFNVSGQQYIYYAHA